MEYLSRLRRVEDQVSDKILMIPRIYTNKPRTTGQGYKGMLHQPIPDAKPDLYKGIVAVRELYMAALRDYDFTCADEMLYPENYRYMSDLLSYVAVGARSVENQQHRLTASGISAPVGMKNPTGGDLSVMMNSIVAAQSSHTFLYRGWEVTSSGNPYAHAILRGYVDYAGRSASNYHYEDLLRVDELYGKSGLINPSVIVDTNHNNSGKQYLEQIRIAKDIVHSRNENATIKRLVKGLMIESYLEDGAQGTAEHVFGKSITDPCLGWEKTERLVLDLAEKL
jgi:3-deoxy-7-phosphoheptulonate synthase